MRLAKRRDRQFLAETRVGNGIYLRDLIYVARLADPPSPKKGSFDKRLAYPSASRQIATAETRSL